MNCGTIPLRERDGSSLDDVKHRFTKYIHDKPFTRISLTLLPLFPLQSQSTLQPPSLTSCKDEETNEGQWATDDIPEFLNAIRRETDAEKLAAEKANTVGTVAVSLAAPPPQNLWAKLQEVRLKNPVSGLMEYAQYLGQNCEFLLLDQSGPSHDPRLVTECILFFSVKF